MRWWPALLLSAMVGCGAGGESGESTAPRLTPEQLSASTVVRPDTPPPCDVDDLVWWTAQVSPSGSPTLSTTTATVRVRNDGAVACEVDIAGSPALSPDAEPNVWLEPGEWGDLVVGSVGDRCSPSVYESVEVMVGDVLVGVPSLGVAACSPTLLAFFVADQPDGPCRELAVVVVGRAAVVRNVGTAACELGPVVGVDGQRAWAPITALAGGDVVAVDLVPVGGECAADATSIRFETAGTVPLPDRSGCPVGGAARPWFGSGAAPELPVDVLDELDSLT